MDKTMAEYGKDDLWAGQKPKAKHITVTLTEDQARDIVAVLEDGIVNNKAWLKRFPEAQTTADKIAFRQRCIDAIKVELVK